MNIVERLMEYVKATARDNEQPDDDQSSEVNSFSLATLKKMYPTREEFGDVVQSSKCESYPEDLLAIMPEDEIELAYASWCIEVEAHEPS